ncbi:uncharacterized protein BJ212DRAFT_891182 [Suillus subaureus]|uniref:Uncharacterized protein n=1 Tax=Suillus subaureus TaxID=48587 RepID=A0A9P7DVV2_9AGAM|nr:uncharacterized protein BJ212DRAFT_891182 [Suillus subaureus]KAG1804521.1 hypothetical protein BJ212DRAFT_891182 [Suillus subaureus]
MTDTPSYDSFSSVFNPENEVWGFEEQQRQQMSRVSYSLTPQMSQMDTYDYAGHVEFPGQFGFSVPFSPLQGATRNGLPPIDTKALGLPRLSIVSDSSSTTSAGSMMPPTPSYSWVPDGHLRVLAAPGTPLSPSNIQYPIFSPSVCLDESITLIIYNRCVRIRRACPLSLPRCRPIRPLLWVVLMRDLCCRLSTTTRKMLPNQWNMS